VGQDAAFTKNGELGRNWPERTLEAIVSSGVWRRSVLKSIGEVGIEKVLQRTLQEKKGR